MMRNITVELYGPGGNYAVVRMPERQSYGVVFQSDSLAGLVADLKEVTQLMKSGASEEAFQELESIRERLAEIAESAAQEARVDLGLP